MSRPSFKTIEEARAEFVRRHDIRTRRLENELKERIIRELGVTDYNVESVLLSSRLDQWEKNFKKAQKQT